LRESIKKASFLRILIVFVTLLPMKSDKNAFIKMIQENYKAKTEKFS